MSPTPIATWDGARSPSSSARSRPAGANLVACDDELVPRQERNLEKELGVPVIDRTAVILDIFADHAGSAEGKLKSSWPSWNTTWPGCAVSGPISNGWVAAWEAAAARSPEAPARLRSRPTGAWRGTEIRSAAAPARRTERNRALMRQRQEQAALPTVALAGDTNAGKSTLLNAPSLGPGWESGNASSTRSTPRPGPSSTRAAASC